MRKKERRFSQMNEGEGYREDGRRSDYLAAVKDLRGRCWTE